jgi:hypothetical protein
VAGDVCGVVRFWGYATGGAYQAAFVISCPSTAVGTTTVTADLTFNNGAGTEVARITSAGNVGIGTGGPSRQLQVTTNATGLSTGACNFGNAVGNLDIGGSDGNNVSINVPSWGLALQTGSTTRMTINTSGQVGIGVAPAYFLQVNTDSAAKPTTSSWTIASDVRLKRNIQPLTGGLSIINRLNPIEAEYNGLDGTPEGDTVLSFDAAEIRTILPRTVTSHRGKLHKDDAEETDILDFNIHEVLMHLILAVQQLAARIQ